MSFADTFAATIAELSAVLENESTSYQGRLYAAEMKLFGISSAIQIASEPQPGVALLDMMVLTTLNRIVWEEYWIPEVYGQQGNKMLAALQSLETNIWDVAAKVLTSEQQKEMRELIVEWRRKYPGKNKVHYIRFSDFDKLGRKPTLEEAMQPGGLLAPVKEAAQAAEQIYQLTERAIYLFSRQLLLINYQAEHLYLELVNKPEIQQLLANTETINETSLRFADLLEKMPEQITDQSDLIINTLIKAVSVERETAINQALNGITAERNATINQLMQEFSAEREAAIKQALDGVGLEGNTLINQIMGNLTNEREAAVEQIFDGLFKKVYGSMVYAFVFCAGLIIIFFLSMFFYRYASTKVLGPK